MGWLLNCFKCTGDPDRAKPKKQLSGVVNLVSGRLNSAAVAHATSPEDLHRVRKSPTNSAVAISKEYVERGGFDPSSSSLPLIQAQSKGARLDPKRNDTEKFGGDWSHEHELEELEGFREQLMQEADAAKQLSDEVKYLRACHSLLESPSNTFKVTFDKSDKDSTGQVDYAQHSWLVSSLVTRIQPGGLLIEACSRPSSPFLEGGSLHSRVIETSQSVDFDDNLGNNTALKCAELNLFRVESSVCGEGVDGVRESLQVAQCKVEHKTEAAPVRHGLQSPPWTFSEAKLGLVNQKNSYIYESSDDLLREHLDISSLIEDSALITNWELSFGEVHTEKWSLHGQSSHVPSQEEGQVKSHSSSAQKKKRSENLPDGDPLDYDSSCSMVVFEVPSDDGTSFSARPFSEALCASNGMPNEAEVKRDVSCNSESIYAQEASSVTSAAEAQFFQAEPCMATEESDNESAPQSCFSSQFRLSKRLWSSTRKNPFEKESGMASYLHHNDSDTHEMLSLGVHSEMQVLQDLKNSEDENYPLLDATTESSETRIENRISFSEHSGVHMDDDIHYSKTSSLEALVWQDSLEVFVQEDGTSTRIGDSNTVSFPTEEENKEHRKKIRLRHSSSSERVHESTLVEDEELRLLDSAAFGDENERSLEARVDVFDGLQSSEQLQFLNESSASDLYLPPSSPSYIHTPSTPVASYRTPARLADDRPILGTVAAHWSPIITRKWWDGKGIPNSTNKYKEDQKVNWHAIPFEVRLEQALAKQDTVLSK